MKKPISVGDGVGLDEEVITFVWKPDPRVRQIDNSIDGDVNNVDTFRSVFSGDGLGERSQAEFSDRHAAEMG